MPPRESHRYEDEAAGIVTVRERDRERERLPDLDAEREVDLGRALTAVATRWWLPLLGLVVGLALGWLLALGGGKAYRASALVYPGTLLAAGGGQLPNPFATPAAIRQVVMSEEAVRRAAQASGMRRGQVRSGISLQQQTATAATRAAGAQFTTISVKGPAPRRVAIAANELARVVVAKLSPFAAAKVRGFEEQLGADEQALAQTAQTIEETTRAFRGRDLSSSDRIALATILNALENRRATLKGDVLNARQLLAQANEYEKPRLIAQAVPRETTARSRRNSVVVGGVIGLLLGLVAALVWEPVTRRAGRTR